MKALFTGIGMATVAGLLLGGAMKPNLNGDDRPEGPQIFAGWSGTRSTGPFDDGVGFAAYRGEIPDYVVGTDWRTAQTWPAQPVEYQPKEAPDYYQQAMADTPRSALPAYEEPARESPLYPSVKGGASYAEEHARQAAQKAPPPQRDQIDEEAPPEATGDTTPIAG